MSNRFEKGDIIRVGSGKDAVVGRATDSLGYTGWAMFSIVLASGKTRHFNINYVETEVVFPATVPTQPQLDNALLETYALEGTGDPAEVREALRRHLLDKY